MSSLNMKELLEAGMNHTDNGNGGEYWKPPANAKYVVQVDRANFASGKDTMRWGVFLEIIKAEDPSHVGQRFWHNLTFHQLWPFITKKAIRDFEALGIGADVLGSNPDPDMLANSLVGKTVVCTAGWSKNKKGGDPFPDHILSPRAGAGNTPPPPPPVEEEDDDDDW